LNNSQSYDSKTIWYHWLSAGLIFSLWIIGQTIDFFPKGTPRITVRSMHITFGVILAVLLIFRIVWKNKSGVKLPSAIPGILGRLSTGAHHALYALITVTVIVGLSATWIRGDNIFNLFQIPAFDPGNKELRKQVVDIHELLANSLLILAILHGMIAMWHHWIKKDDVLKRMLPRLK
jgi:cytochrome b561